LHCGEADAAAHHVCVVCVHPSQQQPAQPPPPHRRSVLCSWCQQLSSRYSSCWLGSSSTCSSRGCGGGGGGWRWPAAAEGGSASSRRGACPGGCLRCSEVCAAACSEAPCWCRCCAACCMCAWGPPRAGATMHPAGGGSVGRPATPHSAGCAGAHPAKPSYRAPSHRAFESADRVSILGSLAAFLQPPFERVDGGLRVFTSAPRDRQRTTHATWDPVDQPRHGGCARPGLWRGLAAAGRCDASQPRLAQPPPPSPSPPPPAATCWPPLLLHCSVW
jgi:hypothetical protein